VINGAKPTCEATNLQGAPCGMPPLANERFCWAHAPANARQRDKARSRGGRHRHGPAHGDAEGRVTLRDVGDVRALLERTAAEALALVNSNTRNRALAAIALAALRANEVGELQERLESLEERLEAREQQERTSWQNRGIALNDWPR
jgi:hypothetical protein